MGYFLTILTLAVLLPPTSSVPVSKVKRSGTPENKDIAKRQTSYDVVGQNKSIVQPEYIPLSLIKGCTLYSVNPNTFHQVREKLDGGTIMIKFNIKLRDGDRQFSGKNESDVYKPFFWVRSTGRQGTGLLLLPPTYDVLSLTTLEYGVETMSVTLGESPSNCLSPMSHKDVEGLLRELVMNDFQNTSMGDLAQMKPLERVCNLHVLNESGTAAFHYRCCHRGEDMVISCQYLKSDIWLEMLFIAITFLKVLVFLYSPNFIPGSLYRLKNVAMPYIHKLDPGNPAHFNLVVTKNPKAHTAVKHSFKLNDFSEMPNFSTKLQTLEEDVPYRLTLEQLALRIKHKRLLPEDYAPVSLLTTLYETCFKCKVRDKPSVKECCETDFFLRCNCTSKVCPWYVLLKGFMKVVLLIILFLPWVLRVCVYFAFEDKEMAYRRQEAESRSLKSYFPGNYTVYLTPIHALFLFIYALLSLESITYGVMKRQTKERFKLVLRKCFRDMKEVSKIEIIGMLAQNLVKPCTRFGGFGIFVAPVLWVVMFPFLLVTVSIYMFPTINITVRLMAYFFLFVFPKDSCSTTGVCSKLALLLKKMERNLEMETLMPGKRFDKTEEMKHVNTCGKRIMQLVIIVLCTISLYSVIFLITEFVSFLVEVFVFTLMGLILNADNLLTYFSLLFLLVVYGNDCFGHVSVVFLAFNKTIHGVVLKLGKEKVREIIYEPKDIQRNRAFRIATERTHDESNIEICKNPEGLPRWHISRLILFLSQDDKPLIPKNFFFQSCKMNYYSVPGELLIAYLRAGLEFSMIIIFLVFVLVVVLAFGDTYDISAGNKLLATVAGGILPFFLRKVFFKTHSAPATDTDSIHFDVCLNQLIDGFEQTWPIYDINVISAERLTAPKTEDEGYDAPGDSGDIALTEMGDTKPEVVVTQANDKETDEDKTTTAKQDETETLLDTKVEVIEPSELKAGDCGDNTRSDGNQIDVLIDISKGHFEYTTISVSDDEDED